MAEENVRRYCVGYASQPKHVRSFHKPSLHILANDRGIDLVPIDISKPIIDQGKSFDCIIHKLYDKEWNKKLKEFSSRNPNVIIVDPPDNIERLRNRVSMIQIVNEVKMCQQSGISIGIPKQIVVENPESFPDCVEIEGLKFPVIAKPLLVDGSANSHQMFVVFNNQGLMELNHPPVILQEFVNHGGVVFKIYVAGEHVKCVKRKSLPDISGETSSENLLPFSLISNPNVGDQIDDNIARLIDEAEMPPSSFVTEIANGLKQTLKLHLFNFDVIRDSKDCNRYLVIDINYFPGYQKLPSYETIITDFLLNIVQEKKKKIDLDDHLDTAAVLKQE